MKFAIFFIAAASAFAQAPNGSLIPGWSSGGGPPTGAASGALTGNYPSPSLTTAGVSAPLQCLDTGAVNAITCTQAGVTAYAAGLQLTVTPLHTNTGAATLTVNALASLPVQRNGAALTGGDYLIGQPVTVICGLTACQIGGSGPWTDDGTTISAAVGRSVAIGPTLPASSETPFFSASGLAGNGGFRIFDDGTGQGASFLGGSVANTIGSGATQAVVFGGTATYPNSIGANSYLSATLYGYDNSIAASSFASNASGQHNHVTAGSHVTVFGGSILNGSADYCSLFGGTSNTCSGQYSGVFSGRNSTASGLDSLAFQYANTASGEKSTAGGFGSTASALGSYAWGTQANAQGIGSRMITGANGAGNSLPDASASFFTGGHYFAGGGPTVENVIQLLSGTYTSGGTITGSAGQTCTLATYNNGVGATATVALTGTNAIATGSPLVISQGGYGFTAAPISATLTNGTATCSGTAVISTVRGMFGVTTDKDGITSGTSNGTRWTHLWTDVNGVTLFGIRNDGALVGAGGTPTANTFTFGGNIYGTSLYSSGATGSLAVNRGDGNYHIITQDVSQNMVFQSSGALVKMLFKLADSAKTVTFGADGSIQPDSGGYKASDSSVGVTVTTCSGFKNGLCIGGI